MQEILQRVHDNGHVYKGIYEGWYCPRCADFKTENELGPGQHVPDPPDPARRASARRTGSSGCRAFQEPLERLYAEQAGLRAPAPALQRGAVVHHAAACSDVSLVAREAPLGRRGAVGPEHVFYVWFDALLNYVTALSFARDGEDLTDEFWPADLHVIGKDILKFHAVFWPALLLAAGLELPRHLFIHGYLLMRRRDKMSKSLGNVLDPFEVMDAFGTDALRYYCFREVSFGQDGSVSTADLRATATRPSSPTSTATSRAARWRCSRATATAWCPTSSSTPRSPPTSTASPSEVVRAARPRGAHRRRSTRIWQRVRRLNRYVEEQAPWKLAKDPTRAERPRRRAALAGRGPARRHGAAVPPTCPRPRAGCWRRWAAGGDAARRRGRPALPASDRGRALRRRARRRRVQRVPPLFPKPQSGPVIDSHTHLDRGRGARRRARRRGRARAGVARILTIGMDAASCRAALAAADALPGGLRRRRPPPQRRRPASTTPHRPSCARWPRTRAAARSARPGLDYYRDNAPRADQERAFAAQIELARETGKPLVIHTRAAEDDTLATLARAGRRASRWSCTASRCPTRLDECLDARLVDLLRRQRHLPEGRRPRRGGRARARSTACWWRPTRPTSRPQAVRKERNQPANVVHTARFVAERRGHRRTRSWRRRSDANAARLFGW